MAEKCTLANDDEIMSDPILESSKIGLFAAIEIFLELSNLKMYVRLRVTKSKSFFSSHTPKLLQATKVTTSSDMKNCNFGVVLVQNNNKQKMSWNIDRNTWPG